MIKKLSFASVLTALTVVCLLGSILLPTGKITLFAITSFCILLTQAECGTKYSVMQYVASALIGILFVPFKLQIILFVFFVGYYPIVKSYIEKLDKVWLEWIVKILFFNSLLIIAYFLVKNFLLGIIDFGSVFKYVFSHLSVVILLAEIVFIIYDYVLSLMASYYINVIKKIIKQKG